VSKVMLILAIVSLLMAAPSLIRIMCGDFRSMFWSDVFFDIVIITVAVSSRNLVYVVATQVVVNMINGWMYQKRADDIYKGLKQKKTNIFGLVRR
jgi:magnesium-transporting ATPase (P-type)